MAVSDRHVLRPLAAFRLADTEPSLLGGRETAVNECLLQVKVTLVVERLGDDGEDVLQHSGPNPLLKTPMAGLVRRVAVWQVRPRGAGPQDPQDAIEHGTVLPPRAPSTVFAARQLGQEGPNEDPLPVREVTGMRRSRQGPSSQDAPWRHPAIRADEPLVAQRRSSGGISRLGPYNTASAL
jgi:hypothetical protein